MILDSITKVVRAYLAGAVAANQPQWNVSWADHDITTHAFSPGANSGVLNSTTPVVLVGSPATGFQRQVKLIAIYNTDTVAVIVTVETYNGSNTRKWFRAALDPDWSMGWEPGGTWHVYDENGILQGSGGGGAVGIAVEEVDGSPAYTGITTLRFDQGDGFVLSQPGAGIARVDATGTPAPDQEARLLAFFGLFNRGL
jgi:hypothetical protein